MFIQQVEGIFRCAHYTMLCMLEQLRIGMKVSTERILVVGLSIGSIVLKISCLSGLHIQPPVLEVCHWALPPFDGETDGRRVEHKRADQSGRSP